MVWLYVKYCTCPVCGGAYPGAPLPELTIDENGMPEKLEGGSNWLIIPEAVKTDLEKLETYEADELKELLKHF